jgi:hypothetical protein
MALVSEKLWERAFQLSYFVLLDRSQARECVARALEKLAVQQSREKRRTYWRGRKSQLTIRRISRPTEDTLQWLICLESEICEKEQESQGRATEADMVVRYIKHLAQLTTVSSSFHVNVGFNRLLRNYSTPEVQQVYELATERYPAGEEYRKAKGKLLNQLLARFERFLKVRRAQYGELQLETHDSHERWCGLIEQCLELFAPWSGYHDCLAVGVAPEMLTGGQLGRAGDSSPRADRLETSRCHWFMHSTCYGRLVERLGFDPPRERLAVPRFLNHGGDDPGSTSASLQRRTAPLSQEETRILRERMAAVAAYRHSIPLRPLKIIAHGSECATLDPAREERCRFEIPDGIQLLEIRSDIAGENRTVATHWIDRDEANHFIAGEYTFAVQGGGQLTLRVLPKLGPAAEEDTGAVVEIETRAVATLSKRWRALTSWLIDEYHPIRPALVSVAIAALGGLAASAYFWPRISRDSITITRMAREVAARNAALAALQHAPSQPSLRSAPRYTLAPQTTNVRGTGGSAREPVVTFAPGDSLAILEIPVQGDERGSYRATLSSFPEEEERLTEMALRPAKRGDHWVVEFPIPAALVQANTHYLLALTRKGGMSTDRYVLEVRKDSAISTH